MKYRLSLSNHMLDRHQFKDFNMMKFIAIILLLIFNSSVSISQTKDGFRGYNWGMHVSKMKEKFSLTYCRAYLEDSSETEYNTNVDRISDIPVKVKFCYFQDRFYYVAIYVSEIYQQKLISICKALWGQGESSSPIGVIWNPKNSKDIGKDTRADFTCKLVSNIDGILLIQSISMNNKFCDHISKLINKRNDELRKEF